MSRFVNGRMNKSLLSYLKLEVLHDGNRNYLPKANNYIGLLSTLLELSHILNCDCIALDGFKYIMLSKKSYASLKNC